MFSPKFFKLRVFTFRKKVQKGCETGHNNSPETYWFSNSKWKKYSHIHGQQNNCLIEKAQLNRKWAQEYSVPVPSGCDFAGNWHQGAQKGSAIIPGNEERLCIEGFLALFRKYRYIQCSSFYSYLFSSKRRSFLLQAIVSAFYVILGLLVLTGTESSAKIFPSLEGIRVNFSDPRPKPNFLAQFLSFWCQSLWEEIRLIAQVNSILHAFTYRGDLFWHSKIKMFIKLDW